MTFTELLEAQRELNSHLSRTPTQEELELAIIDEVGELTKALKWGADTPIPYEGWAWWQREDKPRSSANAVMGECVDIVHFVLTNYLLHEGEKGWMPPHVIDARLKGTWQHEGDAELAVWWLLDGVKEGMNLFRIIWIMAAFGFTRDDFDAAWHKSVEKNLRRWRNG